MSPEEINRRFDYHPPTGDQPEIYAEIRQAFKALALKLAELTPEGREQSLAFTNLEQAQFYANASIARKE